jgi:hypothetical protein
LSVANAIEEEVVAADDEKVACDICGRRNIK